jgi:hypothetical protein
LAWTWCQDFLIKAPNKAIKLSKLSNKQGRGSPLDWVHYWYLCSEWDDASDEVEEEAEDDGDGGDEDDGSGDEEARSDKAGDEDLNEERGTEARDCGARRRRVERGRYVCW